MGCLPINRTIFGIEIGGAAAETARAVPINRTIFGIEILKPFDELTRKLYYQSHHLWN